MKRFSLFVLFAALCVSILAWNSTVYANPLAAKTATSTPKPTRDRTRQGQTGTAQPAPTRAPSATPDSTDIESDASAAAASAVSPGAMTSSILVFNPDASGTATVQVDIYNSSGSVTYSTTVSIAANGAKLIGLPVSVGSKFQGSAMISSDKNVKAIVIDANGNKSARDSYEGVTAPTTNMVLPLVRHLHANTQNSILAIQDSVDASANVTVTLYGADGTVANQRTAALAGHQSVFLNTNSLFPSSTFTGTARITADQNVSVAEQTLYFKDTAALKGMNASEADSTVYLNQVERKMNGAGLAINWSEIYARNNGTSPTNITLELHNANGALAGSPRTITAVPPEGSAQFLLNSASFAGLGNNFLGWAKVISSGQPLAVASLEALNKGNRLYGTNGVGSAQVSTKYVCGDVWRSSTQYSTITVLNTDSAKTAQVIVRLFNPTTGKKIVQPKTVLAPNSSATILLSDSKFSPAGSNYNGMALVLAKGAGAPNIVVTVNNPYGKPKLLGTTGYACNKM